MSVSAILAGQTPTDYAKEATSQTILSKLNTMSVQIENAGAIVSILNVSTAAFKGKNVTCSIAGGESLSGTFSADGNVTFRLSQVGTYVLECEGYIQKVIVNTLASVINITFFGLIDWSTGTDEQIAHVLSGYYEGLISLDDVKSVWSIGDSRTVNLSSMAATGVSESHPAQSVELVILDFNHDNLVSTVNGISKALISVQQKDCLATGGYMNSSSSNSGGWSSCARRTWCNNVYYNALPTTLKSNIKEVKKLTSAGGQSSNIVTTNDKVWLLSEIEILGGKSYSFAGEGTIYPYYNTASNRIKKNGSDGSLGRWWERSPNSANSTYFCSVYDGGTAGNNVASVTYGLAPAFGL